MFMSAALAAGAVMSLASSNSSELVWPDLAFGWRPVVGTITGFLGAALGSAGGVGGGSIFVPTANLILGFDTKTSAALSKCMIMGSTCATVIYNVRRKHPLQASPLVDYDLAMLLQPMLLLGISIGVIFNVIFPSWALTFLLVIIMAGTGVRTSQKACLAWEKENVQIRLQQEKIKLLQSDEASAFYKPLEGDKTERNTNNLTCNEVPFWRNILWKNVAVLCFVWVLFLTSQILQSNTQTCSIRYWIYSLLQIPVAVIAFLTAAIKLYRNTNRQDVATVLNRELYPMKFSVLSLAISGIACLIGGMIAGMVGLGGGFALAPVLLEFGVHPQVFSATATFAMFFSSSLSVAEYYLLHRFPVPYALYLFTVSVVGGFSGQYVMQSLIKLFGRPSIIVILLTSLTILSTFLLGGLGIRNVIIEWRAGDYMGFSSLC